MCFNQILLYIFVIKNEAEIRLNGSALSPLTDAPDSEMSGENVKLFVGNLPIDATQDELNKLFAPYGEINTCSLLRQYAFVTLKGEGAADR